MTNMRCLAIGISDAPPLEYLPGAVNGAKAFAAWTQSLGIKTEILIDDEKPVGVTEVADALKRLLAGRQRIARLFIYFAGHGLARDAGEDLWLLSRWLDDQRAVGVAPLRRRLERYGVDQITIVGDACRSLANSPDCADLAIDPVLGKGPFDPEIPTVDILNAAATFHAAYMVEGATAEDDRCIFSGVLEEALTGARDDAFEPSRGCVTSGSLAKFLKTEVPKRAANYKVNLRPQITAGFLPPDDVYVAAKPATAPALKAWPNAPAAGAMGTSNATRPSAKRGWSTRMQAEADSSLSETALESTRRPARGGREFAPFAYAQSRSALPMPRILKAEEAKDPAEAISRRTQEFESAYQHEGPRPTHFETAAGFCIVDSVANAIELGRFATPLAETQYPEYYGRWWGVAPQPPFGAGQLQSPAPLLVQLTNGCWAGAAVLPGFIGTFTIDQSGVASVIYRRVYAGAGSGRRAESAVAQLRAGALATEAAYDLAARFRDEKGNDPMMGVLAAYLYDGQGDVESVRRTALFMAMESIPVPFDMALLGRMPVVRLADGRLQAEIPATAERSPRSEQEQSRGFTTRATPRHEALVAGVFPWLRQGWALLEDDDPSPLVLPGLAELRKHLLAAQFTTLAPEGGRRLRDMIRGL